MRVKNHPYFNNISFDLIENMKFESPFIFDTEDNFDDSYAQMQENDSIYEGNKEIFIDEVNESNMFKDFYYNIEDILIQNNQIAEGKENKTKTDLTSKTSNKKNGGDTSIVIHNIKSKKNKRRKSAKFIGIQPDEDKKVVNVIRKGNKSGSLRLNLNKVDDD